MSARDAACSGLLGIMGLALLVSCTTYQESPTVDQSLDTVAAKTRTLATTLAARFGTEDVVPFKGSTTLCTDDPEADSPISYLYEAGIKVADGNAEQRLDEVIVEYEADGWTYSANGSFRNLDRDGYRLVLEVDPGGATLGVTGKSPCVDEKKPD